MSEFKRVLLEAAAVAVAGTLLGFAANAVNPDRVVISRDYFFERSAPVVPGTRPAETEPETDKPTSTGPSTAGQMAQTSQQHSGAARGTNGQAGLQEPTEQEIIRVLWDEQGLQALKHAEVIQAVEDPLHDADLYIFIDARDDKQYAEGHIPRAFHLDPYHPERYLAAVLPACRQAQKIIVYCNGGHCEDSVYAARTLLDNGVDWSILFVYAGGYEAWKTDRRPVETGQRLSGKIIEGGGHE